MLMSDVLYDLQKNQEVNCRLHCVEQMSVKEYGAVIVFQGSVCVCVCTMPAFVINTSCPETPCIIAPYFMYVCCTQTNLQLTSQFFCKTYKTSGINIF